MGSFRVESLEKHYIIPNYILEDIIVYTDLTQQGYCKCAKWENIKSLLRLAVVNNRITEEFAKYIEEAFCREK